ncbi:uncharacterized protein LOC123545293 [Mercenaria mercenaria]|uniref:uncharacterized protein LOC123545293 n=1 Tax=Mercenaria mercenaria TaxID=6596 RepID=UPI00234E9A46|nr:uncharacterized protein LOC123545293 [Mercenaria mercenaria]
MIKDEFVLRLILVALFLGLTDGHDKPCCLSKKYFGHVKSITALQRRGGTTLHISEKRFRADYDFDMKMYGETGTVYTDVGGTKSSSAYTMVNDYTHLKSYNVLSNTGSCSVDEIRPDNVARHCVPSTLRLVGSYTVGSGPEVILVNNWEGIHNNLTQSMQTTYDCTPISGTAYGITGQGDTISLTFLFNNYTRYRVSSPDAFKLPDVCLKAEPVVGK